MAKLFLTGNVPDALLQPWLQHLRDFDISHPGCHFEIAAEVPNLSLAEMVEAVKVNPNLNFTEIIRRNVKLEKSDPRTAPNTSRRLALEQMATLVERGAISLADIPKWLRSLAEKEKADDQGSGD